MAQGAPRLVQPGAPGAPTREISPADATDLSGIRHTAADVAFMQQMLTPHAQALEMTALVEARGASAGVSPLARRIARSQADEMDVMREWLSRHGVLVDEHAHHHHGATMPGMLSAEEMEALAAAQPSEVFAFVSGVDADQRMEIGRMRAMLREVGRGSGLRVRREMPHVLQHVGRWGTGIDDRPCQEGVCRLERDDDATIARGGSCRSPRLDTPTAGPTRQERGR